MARSAEYMHDIFDRFRYVIQMKPANRLGVWNVAYVMSFKCKLQIHYVATERETTLTCNVMARSKECVDDVCVCVPFPLCDSNSRIGCMQCSIRDVIQMQSANTYDVTEREITLISTLWRVPKKYTGSERDLSGSERI